MVSAFLVWATRDARPEWVARDLIAQAEHVHEEHRQQDLPPVPGMED